MWREFLGPEARIIGIDLNPCAKQWQEHGFEIFIGSQSDEAFWAKFIKEITSIDVVLDDGGHTYEQQIITTEMLLPVINDKGMLVIEDTHTSYLEGFGPRRHSFINYTINLINRVNQRFGQTEKAHRKREENIYSIQYYESIVAFHVDRKATNLLSESTSNNGISNSAKDYRHHGNSLIGSLAKIRHEFRHLKYIPLAKWLANKVQKFIANQTGRKNLKNFSEVKRH
jgi:hypothetical protein